MSSNVHMPAKEVIKFANIYKHIRTLSNSVIQDEQQKSIMLIIHATARQGRPAGDSTRIH